eukprot:IDg9343t1
MRNLDFVQSPRPVLLNKPSCKGFYYFIQVALCQGAKTMSFSMHSPVEMFNLTSKNKREYIHLFPYASALFGTSDDSSFQLVFLVLLRNVKNECHILIYSSLKLRRIIRSK